MSAKTKLFEPRPSSPEKGDGFWVNNDEVDRIRAKCNRPLKLLVLFYILNRVMAEAQCRRFNVSVERLAKLSGLKPRAVERHLSGLRYCGVAAFKPSGSGTPGELTVTILGEVQL